MHMSQYWLMKSEPETYSIDQFAKDRKTLWSGVRNYQARNFMVTSMRPGNTFFFYHSSTEPAGIVGLGEILKINQIDPTAFDKKSEYFDPKSKKEKPTWFCAEVGFKEKWKTPVTLAELRQEPALAKMVLLQRGSRLSIQPVGSQEFAHIMKMKDARK